MALLGIALILLATSGLGWPVALGWAVVAAVFAGIEFRARTKRTRVFVPLLAIPCLPIMSFSRSHIDRTATCASVFARFGRDNRGRRRRLRFLKLRCLTYWQPITWGKVLA
jgi:hypothetical protein